MNITTLYNTQKKTNQCTLRAYALTLAATSTHILQLFLHIFILLCEAV